MKFDKEDYKRRYDELVNASVIFDDFLEDYDEIIGLPNNNILEAMEVLNGFILDINPYCKIK